MNFNRYFRYNPDKELFVVFASLIACVLANIAANLFSRSLYYLFYQVIFGLGICISFPLVYVRIIKKEPLESIGLTAKGWLKALFIAGLLVAISLPGQLINKDISFPPVSRLTYICTALIMSTMFEELFFRGFLQTRFEKAFGIVPAVLLSGIAFALYHLGYPKFRTMELIITMCLVGTYFAVAFRLTNNVITSFTVNLPHAVVTYLLRPQAFPDFNRRTALVSLPVIVVAVAIIILAKIKEQHTTSPAPLTCKEEIQ
jgi:membrane protease YdiL (CAAX protease family)